MSNAVRVVVRGKPTNNFAQQNLELTESDKTIKAHVHKKADLSYLDNQREDYIFKFDSVLQNCSQESIFDESASDIILSFLDGYNGTIMAYGQTGAGKSYTMTGPPSNFKQRGVIPRAVEKVFQEVHNRPEKSIQIRVSYLEIYNEQLIDLLEDVTPHKKQQSTDELQIMEDPKGGVFVRGLSQILANDEEEALRLMFEGETNRAITEHRLNQHSSRSHCIFTIYCESRSRVESGSQVIISKLHLVDLAGSERVGKTHSTGQVLKEAMYINKSLSFLEQVVIALSTPSRDHVPYRQSKLTYYLKDSLGGNSKTTMIANIWCENDHMEETISTLKFASRMMRITNEAIVNIVLSPDALIKKYEKQVKELKQELAMHDQLKGVTQSTYDDYSEEQKLDLRKKIRRYINNEIDELEIKNLRQIKETFAQFKVICQNVATEIEEKLKQNYVKKSADSGGGANVSQQKSTNDDGVGELQRTGGFSEGRATQPNSKYQKPTTATSAPNGSDSNAVDSTDEAQNSRPQSSKQNVPKTEAYEQFKKEDGAELVGQIKNSTTTLNEKKKQLKTLGLQVNTAKKKIDEIKEAIDTKKIEREASSEKDVVDQEEMLLFKSMQDAKKEYRNLFEERKSLQTEIEYLVSSVDSQRQQLVNKFEEWYHQHYTEQEKQTKTPIESDETTQEDPEATSYYRAYESLKHTKSRERTAKRL